MNSSVFTVHEETQQNNKRNLHFGKHFKDVSKRAVIVRKQAGANESRVVCIEPVAQDILNVVINYLQKIKKAKHTTGFFRNRGFASLANK